MMSAFLLLAYQGHVTGESLPLLFRLEPVLSSDVRGAQSPKLVVLARVLFNEFLKLNRSVDSLMRIN